MRRASGERSSCEMSFSNRDLRVHRLFQALGHGVEIAHQLRHFVTPSRGKAARSRAEIACRQTPRSGSQANHWRGQVSRQQITDQARTKQSR